MRKRNYAYRKSVSLLISLFAVLAMPFAAWGDTGAPTEQAGSGIVIGENADPGSAAASDTEQSGGEAAAETAVSDVVAASGKQSADQAEENAAEEAAAAEAETSASASSGVITCGGHTAAAGSPETPGAAADADSSTASAQADGVRGDSLGMFTTTGYCTCTKCCAAGWTLTYSGTEPKAGHTISADISHYPIGTRLMIDGIIYTVEDIGSHVEGNWIDIYYDNHEAAVAHGMKQQEVFTVIPDSSSH